MLPEEEGHRSGSDRPVPVRTAVAACRGWRREPPPARPAREREDIEQCRVVLGAAGAEDFGFPGAGGNFEAVQLLDDRRQSLEARGPFVRLDPLPDQEEPEEVGGADRLDLGAEPVQGVAVDPGEEAPLAPLEHGTPRSEPAAEDDAFGFQRGERCLDVRHRDPEGAAESRGSRRPGDLEPTADQLPGRFPAGGQRLRQREPLRRHPESGKSGRAAVVDQLIEEPQPGAPVPPRAPLDFGEESGDQQRVVQLVGVLDLGPRLVAHPGDCVGVERTEVIRRAGLEGAPGIDRLGAPLLERSVVEERVRLGVQDLRREG